MNEEYKTENLDHLGIVAGICEQIGLIEQIDARMPDTGRKVSVGQAVQAMVINGLGFVGRALYLTPEFYRSKPIDLLVGEGIEAEDLNSDSLGKALDHLYQAGISEIFAAVCAHALRVFGIVVRFAHLDTTAFSLQGNYKVEEGTDTSEAEAISINYGYTKDHRPDLKQAILGMICANRTSIPTYLNALSGNVSDKTSMPEIAEVYLAQFSEEEETPILVADAALYSADNIKRLSENQWVSRVPATINQAKTLLAQTDVSQMIASERETYFYHEVESNYGDVEQRWLIVLSEARRQQELDQFERRILREQAKLSKQAKKLQRQVFNCEADARKAFKQFTKPWKFHAIVGDISSSERYVQVGRPTADSPTVNDWQIQVSFEPDEAKISQAQQPLGKYIIATNVLDKIELPAEELLSVYKEQNCSVERGFRFLKDPFFFASSFFLKKPSRIMALLMIMGLSLLIYALAEHHLRQQLLEQGQSIPDQKGKSTQNPTMRRVFQMFEGIHILNIETAQFRKRMVTNVQEVHFQIATLLGEPILKFYTFDESTL
jgi:transposase